MGNVKEYLREQIIKAAGNFLCEPADGDLYDIYVILKSEQKEGMGSDYASNYVDIPESISAFNSVDQIVDLIEAGAMAESQMPEFLTHVDWPLLKKQKKTLLEIITLAEMVLGNHSTEEIIKPSQELADDLNGILNLIDSIQDYVVDTCGLDENLVFDLHDDEDETQEGK